MIENKDTPKAKKKDSQITSRELLGSGDDVGCGGGERQQDQWTFCVIFIHLKYWVQFSFIQ